MIAGLVTGPALFSDAWFSRLAAMLAKVAPEKDRPRLDLGVSVEDAPSGPVRYTIHLGPDGAVLEAGSIDAAAVTLVESFDTARAIDAGASISDRLGEGRVTVRGDASALVAAQRALASLSAVLAELTATAHDESHEERPQ